MHSCKGLEFPLVAVPGAGMPGVDEEREEENARLLYVAMTRATRELLVWLVGYECLSRKRRRLSPSEHREVAPSDLTAG